MLMVLSFGHASVSDPTLYKVAGIDQDCQQKVELEDAMATKKRKSGLKLSLFCSLQICMYVSLLSVLARVSPKS